MNRFRFWLLVVLAGAALLSALGVVYAKHTSRSLFFELQELRALRDALQVEWGQLQLEQSTLTQHGRVEGLARDRLGMKVPGPEAVVVVKLTP